MRHAITPFFVASAFALAACGGGSDDDAAPPTDEPAEQPDSTPDDSGSDDVAAGSGASGGPIADDFGRICDLLDAQAVADIMSIEPVSQPNGVGGGTGLCEYGAEASVTLVVTDQQEQMGLSAQEFFDLLIADERANGNEVAEAPLMGLPRAAWIEGESATVVVALEPYLIQMTDANGQDIALSVLIGGVADALR